MNLKKTITLFLCLGTILCTPSTVHAKIIEDHIMMDQNNMLKHNFWFIPSIKYLERNYVRTTLNFKLPGINKNDTLICIIKNKRVDNEEINITNLTYNEQTKTFSSSEISFNYGNFEILLYHTEQIPKNFIAKSELVLLDNMNEALDGTYKYDIFKEDNSLLDPSNKPKLIMSGINFNSNRQAVITIPKNLIPRGIYCLKVVTFANESVRNGEPINIDINSFEMMDDDMRLPYEDTSTPRAAFCASMNWPDTATSGIFDQTYEYHFYSNEIKPENFLFKSYLIT